MRGNPRLRTGQREGLGLSPRMRGNHRRTPKKWGYRTRRGPKRVYPRACGGTVVELSRRHPRIGGTLTGGSIPAHAGEPGPCRVGVNGHGFPDASGLSPRMRGNRSVFPIPEIRTSYRVYPRACGGTNVPSHLRMSDPGSGSIPAHAGEPRSHLRATMGHGEGSIPAHAGEPAWTEPRERSGRVYPRACGGTVRRAMLEGGSIPAHAGEPGHPAAS